jgi:two-component sensor histidine kinase
MDEITLQEVLDLFKRQKESDLTDEMRSSFKILATNIHKHVKNKTDLINSILKLQESMFYATRSL